MVFSCRFIFYLVVPAVLVAYFYPHIYSEYRHEYSLVLPHHYQGLAKHKPLSFDVTVEDIENTVARIILQSNVVCEMVASLTNPTFKNAIIPLAELENQLSEEIGIVTFLKDVSPSKSIREASAHADQRLYELYVDLNTHEDLYDAIIAVFANKTEMEQLDPEDYRVVEQMVHEMKINGMELSNDDRKCLASINKLISEKINVFSTNVNEDASYVSFTRSELEGLPDSFFENRNTEVIEGIKKYIVRSKTPDDAPVYKYAQNSETRRRLSIKSKQMCTENIVIAQEIAELRRQQAQLLGYKRFAEFILDSKIAKTPANVLEFENGLHSDVAESARAELNDIYNAKRNDLLNHDKTNLKIYSYDKEYYSNIVVKERYNFTDSEINHYFPVDYTIPNMLRVLENMFGLNFTKINGSSVWHPDVLVYEVWDGIGGFEFLGHLYLDLFPRPSKYNHAATWTLREGYARSDGTRQYPVAAIVANVQPPTLSTPSLLTHHNIMMLFHELGHAIHNICSQTKWSRFHGTKVERDFVEAPSQLTELLAFEPAVLMEISLHYLNRDHLSPEIIQQMLAARNDFAHLSLLGAIHLALYDMAIHSSDDTVEDINSLFNQLYEEITMLSLEEEETWRVATFTHSVLYYPAGFYGYLWAKVYSADMYESRFAKDGFDDLKTSGIDYRNEILLPGGSRDGQVSLERFLGRKPNSDAFLKLLKQGRV